MGWLKKPGSYFLLVLLIGILVILVVRLGTTVGSHFTTVTSCPPDSFPCGTTTGVPVSGTVITELTPGDSTAPVEKQLEQIDQLLNQSIQSSIAYNVPATVALDQAVTIELLLNPS